MTPETRDDGFDDLLDAIEADAGYYLACENGHGSFPPRRVCPDCGSQNLSETPLPETGEIRTYTTIAVPTPQFAGDAPYVTAIVDFGPVALTGQVRGIEPGEVQTGMIVDVDVGETVTTGERVVTFSPG